MTAREPSAVEVIAEAARGHLEDLDVICPLGERNFVAGDVPCNTHQRLIDRLVPGVTEAVLAAIRAMSVAEQAELIGGAVIGLRGYSWVTGRPVADEVRP